MKLTKAHYEFYMFKKGYPKMFAGVLERTHAKPSIHSLIPHERVKSTVLGNTLVVLKMARKRGEMMNLLVQMSVRADCIDGDKREAWCKRWLRRLNKDLVKRVLV